MNRIRSGLDYLLLSPNMRRYGWPLDFSSSIYHLLWFHLYKINKREATATFKVLTLFPMCSLGNVFIFSSLPLVSYWVCNDTTEVSYHSHCVIPSSQPSGDRCSGDWIVSFCQKAKWGSEKVYAIPTKILHWPFDSHGLSEDCFSDHNLFLCLPSVMAYGPGMSCNLQLGQSLCVTS